MDGELKIRSAKIVENLEGSRGTAFCIQWMLNDSVHAETQPRGPDVLGVIYLSQAFQVVNRSEKLLTLQLILHSPQV